jgi:prolyl oligopeptidase
MTNITYPTTHAVNQVDNYHGTLISDPYRWLEDVDSPDTRAWIRAQNELTFSFLEGVPKRAEIQQRLTELWNFPKYSAPRKYGERYFQLRNTGLQNQDVLYVLMDPSEGGSILLDPNILSEDGTVALTYWDVSHDGSLIAYATSHSGSDWLTWHVRDVTTGIDLHDIVEWSKFSSAAWLHDNSGFFYSHYDAPKDGLEYAETNFNQKLYLHRLKSRQLEDELVYQRPDHKEWGFSPTVSNDGCYLVISVSEGTDTRNRLFYRDLQNNGEVVELINTLEAAYDFVGSNGSVFYIRTDYKAPNGKLIAIDINNPAREQWELIIPEGDDTLVHLVMVHNEIVALYLHDAHHKIMRFTLEGHFLEEIPLPSPGSIVSVGDDLGLHGNREDDELFFSFQSFLIPPSAYCYDFQDQELKVLNKPNINFDFSKYETHQIFVPSKDGTQIPLFLIHKRNLVYNSKNPTLLYGYGGFNISITPSFAINRLVWLENDGVFVQACLRGGGEYGENWHKAGMLHYKQNVFDDFIACAEYLIETGITSSQQLGIEGRSNGGLLVGACMTQRPDLFGAALPAVGVMDMLRFHKFTIGWAWVSDYGSSDNPEGFNTLIAYSPLHNIKPGIHYPATLITTGDHDDRVVPGHSFKFAASLQIAQAGEKPILIRIQTKAGHGFGKPTGILIDENSDILAFLMNALKTEQNREYGNSTVAQGSINDAD